ncbi:hypothetical protein C0991_008670 [Blastosporella zonata]|nr:hypothetical protein C0991_008670 [Blastosporella zonata]
MTATVTMPPLESSSSTSSSSASSVTSIPPRRIRFAPLPDPHAHDALHIDTACLPDPKSYSLSSSPSSDEQISPKPTTQQLLSHPPITHVPSWQKPKSLNLLRPFPFRRSQPPAPTPNSSHSLTPTQSNDNTARPSSSFHISTEEILTLGTINLFRTSSKASDSTENASSPSWTFGLTRWSSASSNTGVPLSRSQSAQSSYAPSISSKLKLSSLKRSSKPRPAPIEATTTPKPPSAARKGTRMLNGRVYGAKKRDPNANPFASARDEDPEFVEWGYGGMGSVRGGRQAGVTDTNPKTRTRWERLQSDGTFMTGVAGGEKKGVGGTTKPADDDDDDGSGMGWVKKRKEQREKEKREQEEREASERTPQPEPPKSESVEPPIIVHAPEDTTTPLEHNLTTVTIPTHLPRHHSHPHRRTASRTSSMETVPMLPPTTSVPSPLAREDLPSSSSESDSEYDDNDEEEDDDDDEEEDEETREHRRKMVLGAGVEKVSRHNQ